jgi:hypothetical protein
MNSRTALFGGTVLILLLTGIRGHSQNCRELTATYSAYESRCTATGALQVRATGGSGTYNYKMTGPSTVDYTSSSYITGLQPGTYTLTVRDVSTNCTVDISNIVIPGTYITPRFGLTETDVTCNNGSDGVISVAGAQNGRQPYVFKLVAPSPMGVGTVSSTGTFTGLKPGTYSVQMTDSCGGIQTRTVSIQNYTWSITSTTVTLSNCQSYNGKIVLTDSKGNTNASGTAFNGYQYGVARKPGDTSWYTTPSFVFSIGDARTISLLAKDRCGQVQTVSWTNTNIPSVAANPTISGQTCTTFNVAITGQTNLTNPQYCIVDAAGHTVAGQPCNTTGTFTNVPYGSYCIKVTNSCYDTVISRCFTQTKSVPAISATANISFYTCTTFTASVTGQANLTNPQYCIVDAAGRTIPGQPCNASGMFNNLPYGTYTINLKDGCSGTILPVTVNGVKRTRSVNSTITTGNTTCSSYTATLGGATNMTNPQYCLLDSLGHQVTCNSTGIFPNTPYGNYCIKVTDGCGDTSITRCINMTRPVPDGGGLTASNKGCRGYTVTVTGQQNIYNGQYCLLDSLGHQVTCNTTGVFTNVPYGKICVRTTDGCIGGVFTSCLTTTAAVPSVGPVVISNLTCSTYIATVSNQQNLISPTFCLYNANGVQLQPCDSTGVFNVTGSFGSFTIRTTDGCTGKVFTSPFTVARPVSSVNAALSFSNQTCSSFAVTVTGQTNLAGAQYVLKNSAGTVVATSTNGAFTNISYGSYCINITNACKDTTIQRCFSLQPPAIGATATATPSCTYTATDVAIQVTAGTGPYQVKVYDTLYNILSSSTFSGSTTSVKGLPSLPTAGRFRVVITGACGKPDTLSVTATPSAVTHSYSITPQCPSSVKANGSDNLVVTATSNLSGLSVSLIKQDTAVVSIGYSFRSGNNFTFSNLDAATYVLAYTFSGCTSTVYDTLVMPTYAFPSLSKSSAYQCDNNSFSVGAAVTGGIAPYTYEIIASNPSKPSLVTAPQSNPVFFINNNTQYNLIRLRATDACGNAALNDVSVLPLANTIVKASSDCINQSTTLSTEALPNATYSWYKKSKTGDSTLLSTGSPSYTIPSVRFSDTGLYVAKTSVNSGCLTRIAYFRITGTCGTVLPVGITLEGKAMSNSNQLSWNASSGVREYELQRSHGVNTPYVHIGVVHADASDGNYIFMDNAPGDGSFLYRLHIIYDGGNDSYSNVVQLGETSGPVVTVYPNPVDRLLNIRILGGAGRRYMVSLYSVAGECVFSRIADNSSMPIQYERNAAMVKGMYILKVLDTEAGTYSTYKLQFR